MKRLSLPLTSRSDLFSGVGTVIMANVLPESHCPRSLMAALWCELEAGGHVGRHLQSDCDEVILFVEGAGRAAVAGEIQPVRRGTLLGLPVGETLEIWADSFRPLQYVIVKMKPVDS